MDILQDATRFLAKKIQEIVGQTVTVVQGENSYDLTVTVAYDESTSEETVGIIYNARALDFLVNLDDLETQGMRDFVRGDKFIWTIEHKDTDEDENEIIVRTSTREFEAVSDGNEPVWRPDSRYMNWARVHTKRINYERVEPPPPVVIP